MSELDSLRTDSTDSADIIYSYFLILKLRDASNLCHVIYVTYWIFNTNWYHSASLKLNVDEISDFVDLGFTENSVVACFFVQPETVSVTHHSHYCHCYKFLIQLSLSSNTLRERPVTLLITWFISVNISRRPVAADFEMSCNIYITYSLLFDSDGVLLMSTML